MTRFLTLCVLLCGLITFCSLFAEDEKNSPEDLRKLGLHVVQDETRPGRPVVRVSTTQSDPKTIQAICQFTDLTRFELWHDKTEKAPEFTEKVKLSPQLTTLVLVAPRSKFLDNLSLKDYPKLTKLTLNGMKDPTKFLDDVGTLKDLEELNLANTNIKDDTIKQIVKCQNLRLLSLESSSETVKPSEISYKLVSELPKLEVLRLNNTTIGSFGFIELGKLKELRELELDNTKLSDADLKVIATLPKLTKLSIRKTKITDEGIKELVKLTELTSLEIGHNDITPKQIKQLQQITKLTNLDLCVTKINDESVKHLSQMKTLTNLHLAITPITNQCVSDLLKMNNLLVLDLSFTNITDIALIDLRELKNLKVLHSNGSLQNGDIERKAVALKEKDPSKLDPKEKDRTKLIELDYLEERKGTILIRGRIMHIASTSNFGSFGLGPTFEVLDDSLFYSRTRSLGNMGMSWPVQKYGYLPR